MKESEFIELLNLYLDHEISAADAARLEAEVQNHPERRKVYRQYCRMQKACKVLTVDFQTDEAVVSSGEKKVIAFDPASAAATQRQRMGGFYTVGAFAAAAACVAIIFVGKSRQQRAESVTQAEAVHAATATSPVPVAPTASFARTTSSPRALGRSQSSLMADPLLLSDNAQGARTVVTTSKDANDQLDWIRTVQLVPLHQQLQAQQLRFDLPPATLQPEARGIRANRPPTEAAVEMTAFQFVK